MLPNRFPDQDDLPEYNTADATLWFFVALRAYVRSTADTSLATELLPMLRDVIRWHREGTRFAIRVDGDGLLRAGEPGVQLTWMDARVGDRVVTPRSGKPVEINALWYNALRILAELEAGFGNPEAGAALGREADRVHRRFSRTFWYAVGGYLYDVVDGEAKDTALRPNQILACSLPFPLLSSARRRSVLRVVEEQLLTPVGLRSLAPNHPSYRPHYDGDVLTRDSAYHQGTVWPWLLGPWVTAVVREWGARGRMAAAELIERAVEHLSTAGVGTFSEIFDGDPPHAPRGAIAQAWSIAELLRAWVEDVNGVSHCPAAPRRLGRDRGIVTSRVRVLDTPERVAAAAADLFVEAARGAIASRGRFGVALSGGRTPETVYDLLAGPPRRGFVDWPRVHLFWGDERCVPPEHPDSNYGAAERALLRHVPLDQAQVHRIRGEIAPHQAADEYEAELLAYLHERPGPGSVLDLVLLGLGADGHTASLFPDTEAFRRALAGEETRWVVANNVPALDAWRVTLTTRAINGSRRVAVLVTGAAKAVALREVLAAGPDAAPQLPIQLVNSAAGQVDWLVDSAAAALLPAPGGRGR
jgi:6-phosphogluconolactonase